MNGIGGVVGSTQGSSMVNSVEQELALHATRQSHNIQKFVGNSFIQLIYQISALGNKLDIRI